MFAFDELVSCLNFVVKPVNHTNERWGLNITYKLKNLSKFDSEGSNKNAKKKLSQEKNTCVFPNNGFSPQIIHFSKVFHYFHHPFWGVFPLFLETSTCPHLTTRMTAPKKL